MFQNEKIRPLALMIVKNQDKLLVTRGFDENKGEEFFRIPGGGIEFGETSEQALRREAWEEFGTELTQVKFLKVLENIFDFNGSRGHEIVFVYQAELTNQDLYGLEKIKILDSPSGKCYSEWLPLAGITGKKLYPDGVSGLL
jgi:8-oxo-dGTP pyrophosphatase MutT (NUDIX family)